MSINPPQAAASDHNGNPSKGTSDLVIIGASALVVGATVALTFAGRQISKMLWAESPVKNQLENTQELEMTLARIKKVSASLLGDHKEFGKNLAELPEHIKEDYEQIIRTPVNELSINVRRALEKLKASDEYPLIVQSCNGTADPEKVALGKIFFESQMRSIEEQIMPEL